jgi:hypothetical protein
MFPTRFLLWRDRVRHTGWLVSWGHGTRVRDKKKVCISDFFRLNKISVASCPMPVVVPHIVKHLCIKDHPNLFSQCYPILCIKGASDPNLFSQVTPRSPQPLFTMLPQPMYKSWPQPLFTKLPQPLFTRLPQPCVCLLLQDLLQSCSRGGEEESGRHVLW